MNKIPIIYKQNAVRKRYERQIIDIPALSNDGYV